MAKESGDHREETMISSVVEAKEGGKAIGANTDITDQKYFKEALETKVKERTLELYEKILKLEQTNAELISFSNISSHDLQEPLRKILIFSARILETEADTLSKNALNYLERMQQSAHRMQNLLQDLTAYSRTNVKATKFETTDLNLIIEDVKITLSEELEQKDVTFNLKNICALKIIPLQFTQAILNLLSNSIKFAKDDQPLVIDIACEEVKGSASGIPQLASQQVYTHIRITDNGIGFEPQYNTRIFEVFQRLHGREEYSGTGMGLAIVKRVIENHDGLILANGKQNAGATFDIYIPAH